MALIGALLVQEQAGLPTRVGRIVEVEAYGGPEDKASHARAGRTSRTGTMFGPAGHAYVYLVYGMHHCLNVVTGPDGTAAAALLRAVEPLEGIEVMRSEYETAARRRTERRADEPDLAGLPTGRDVEVPARALPPATRLAAGPGRLGLAFGITRAFDGADLCDPRSPLRLEPGRGSVAQGRVAWAPRVGVRYADMPWASLAWRVFDPASPSLSVRPRGRTA